MPIRWMAEEDARAFLPAGAIGRLATCDRASQPYITPLKFVYRGGRIYFHCKLTGRKLENLAENSRVCFEVIDPTEMTISEDRPCSCAARYQSALAFGTARVVADPVENAALLNLLVEKHAAGKPFQPVDEQQAAGCAVVEICVERISG